MLSEITKCMDLLDDPQVNGESVRAWLRDSGVAQVELNRVQGAQRGTDFVKVHIPGCNNGPTFGIVGRLMGVGGRPDKIGLVSDADGCIVALACAARLAKTARRGDRLRGDVIIATHICPNAPITPHEPTPFMGPPVDMDEMNEQEIDPGMVAILSVDATKGNWVLNRRGFAITPTVKEGYILRISEHLMEIMRYVTGEQPLVLPITTQDITPYDNGLFHINSIMQPAVATSAPVVGVALSSAIPVAGCATSASQPVDLEMAARFCLEVAKAFTDGECQFYDPDELGRLVALYGSMKHLQGIGRDD